MSDTAMRPPLFPNVIAIAGLKGSGKNTVADILISEYNVMVPLKTIAFANPIRKQIEHIFSLDGSDKQYDSFKRSTMLFNVGFVGSQSIYARRAVREIGMLMRMYDENQFVQYVQGEMFSDEGKRSSWIITDLRFLNELNYLKSINAYIVKVDRDVEKDNHITEEGIYDSDCNVIFDNNGTKEDLVKKVKEHFNQFLR